MLTDAIFSCGIGFIWAAIGLATQWREPWSEKLKFGAAMFAMFFALSLIAIKYLPSHDAGCAEYVSSPNLC